jgi:hypothetical protein
VVLPLCGRLWLDAYCPKKPTGATLTLTQTMGSLITDPEVWVRVRVASDPVVWVRVRVALVVILGNRQPTQSLLQRAKATVSMDVE